MAPCPFGVAPHGEDDRGLGRGEVCTQVTVVAVPAGWAELQVLMVKVAKGARITGCRARRTRRRAAEKV